MCLYFSQWPHFYLQGCRLQTFYSLPLSFQMVMVFDIIFLLFDKLPFIIKSNQYAIYILNHTYDFTVIVMEKNFSCLQIMKFVLPLGKFSISASLSLSGQCPPCNKHAIEKKLTLVIYLTLIGQTSREDTFIFYLFCACWSSRH